MQCGDHDNLGSLSDTGSAWRKVNEVAQNMQLSTLLSAVVILRNPSGRSCTTWAKTPNRAEQYYAEPAWQTTCSGDRTIWLKRKF
jgi:hypothetical protein